MSDDHEGKRIEEDLGVLDLVSLFIAVRRLATEGGLARGSLAHVSLAGLAALLVGLCQSHGA